MVSDDKVLEALGAAQALMHTEGEPPSALVTIIAQGPGAHIRKHAYRYVKPGALFFCGCHVLTHSPPWCQMLHMPHKPPHRARRRGHGTRLPGVGVCWGPRSC